MDLRITAVCTGAQKSDPSSTGLTITIKSVSYLYHPTDRENFRILCRKGPATKCKCIVDPVHLGYWGWVIDIDLGIATGTRENI